MTEKPDPKKKAEQSAASEDGDTADVSSLDDLFAAEDADTETKSATNAAGDGPSPGWRGDGDLSIL